MRAARSARGLAVAALWLVSCGYRPLYANDADQERFAVVGASPLVADAAVVAEVEAGARAALARAGRLATGSGYPRVVVEVLRLDAASEGIVAGQGTPIARGTRVGVVARAWLERGSDPSERERDTGDVRAVDLMATEGDPRLEALRYDGASKASARRLGERLAGAVLGEPVAKDDGM